MRSIVPVTMLAVLAAVLISTIWSGTKADWSDAGGVSPTSVVRAYVKSQNSEALNFHLAAYKVKPKCKKNCVYAVAGSYAKAEDEFRICNLIESHVRVRRVVLQRYEDTCLGETIKGPLT